MQDLSFMALIYPFRFPAGFNKVVEFSAPYSSNLDDWLRKMQSLCLEFLLVTIFFKHFRNLQLQFFVEPTSFPVQQLSCFYLLTSRQDFLNSPFTSRNYLD